jgi:disulfide bond formation protein DsbB
MTGQLKPWMVYTLGAAICAGLIGFALYLQYVKGTDPCPLCMLQRIGFIGIGAVCTIAAIHRPGRIGTVIYGAALMVFATAGGAVAARQVWLQSLPKNMVPECGPGLDYILDRFPLSKAIDMIVRGSGECAEKGWTWLGLSIAGWSLVWFVLFAAGALALTVPALRRRDPRDMQNK